MNADANPNCKKLICSLQQRVEYRRANKGHYQDVTLTFFQSSHKPFSASCLICQAQPEFSSCFRCADKRSWFPGKIFLRIYEASKHIIPQDLPPALQAVWARWWGVCEESDSSSVCYRINTQQLCCQGSQQHLCWDWQQGEQSCLDRVLECQLPSTEGQSREINL